MAEIRIRRGTTQELTVVLKDRPGDFGLPIAGTNWKLEILGAGWGDVVYTAPTTSDRGIGRRAALVTFDFPSGDNYLIRWSVTDPTNVVRQLTTDIDIVSPIGRSESTWDLTAESANALVPGSTGITDSILREAVIWVERKIPYHPSEIPLLEKCLDGSPNLMGLRDIENVQLGIAYRAAALVEAGVVGDGSEGAGSGNQIVTTLDEFKSAGYLVSSMSQSAGSMSIGVAVPNSSVQAVEVDEDNEKTRIAVEWLQRLSRYRPRPQVLRLGGEDAYPAPQPIRGFSSANGLVMKPWR